MGLVFFWTRFKVWIKWALESYLEDEIFVLLIAQYGCWLDSNFSLDFPGHRIYLQILNWLPKSINLCLIAKIIDELVYVDI